MPEQPKTVKPVRCWAIVFPDGRLYPGAFRTRAEAIRDWENGSEWTWPRLRRVGYSVVRCTLTVEGGT